MKRKRTLPQLKKKLDEVFSRYIRKRWANDDGYATCVTCWTSKPWKEMQAGHYYSRRHNSVRWDERNSHPQCGRCNVLRAGNYPQYARFMLAQYGQMVLDELDALHRMTWKPTRAELEELIERYSRIEVVERPQLPPLPITYRVEQL